MRAGVCFCDEDVRTVSEGGQLEETLRAQNKSEQSCLTAKERKASFSSSPLTEDLTTCVKSMCPHHTQKKQSLKAFMAV